MTAAIFGLEITRGTSETQRFKPVTNFEAYAANAAELTEFSRTGFGWVRPTLACMTSRGGLAVPAIAEVAPPAAGAP